MMPILNKQMLFISEKNELGHYLCYRLKLTMKLHMPCDNAFNSALPSGDF